MTIFTLHSDSTLWYPPDRQQVDGNVRAFQARAARRSTATSGDSKLWIARLFTFSEPTATSGSTRPPRGREPRRLTRVFPSLTRNEGRSTATFSDSRRWTLKLFSCSDTTSISGTRRVRSFRHFRSLTPIAGRLMAAWRHLSLYRAVSTSAGRLTRAAVSLGSREPGQEAHGGVCRPLPALYQVRQAILKFSVLGGLLMPSSETRL